MGKRGTLLAGQQLCMTMGIQREELNNRAHRNGEPHVTHAAREH